MEKQDEETKNPLSGGIYGLYAAEDIKVDGKTVVPKGTLIEKATTGADGKASYKAELPINYSYSIREIQAPERYLRNSEDTYTFTFKFTNDKEEKVNFSHTFTNKRVNATIDLVKKTARQETAHREMPYLKEPFTGSMQGKTLTIRMAGAESFIKGRAGSYPDDR